MTPSFPLYNVQRAMIFVYQYNFDICLSVQFTHLEWWGSLGLIVLNDSLLYKHCKFKSKAQLGQGNDSYLNVLAHMSVGIPPQGIYMINGYSWQG